MLRDVIPPRAMGRLLDGLALFVTVVEEQEQRLRLCTVCRRETGVEAHRPRCAYAAAKDVLQMVASVSANRPDTIDERVGAVREGPNLESP